jgi:hypothetical protein
MTQLTTSATFQEKMFERAMTNTLTTLRAALEALAGPNPFYAIRKASEDLRSLIAELEAQEKVIAPHFLGYARLGIGAYVINHSADDADPELVISIATEEEKSGRSVGEDRDNKEGALIQPADIAVRIAFENVAGLDALEKQLRRLRESHFQASPPAQPKAEPPKVSFEDQRVQAVYDVLCSDEVPPEGEHWDGFAARRIVDLFSQPKAEPVQEPHKFLADGTRFKTTLTERDCKITGLPRELGGRWVALVAAENDCHLAAAPQTEAEPARLTDEEIYSVVISAEAMTPYEFARAIERKVRGDV